MRSIFIVVVPADHSQMARSLSVPANQRLREALQILLILPGAFESQGPWSSPAAYQLRSLYGEALDPNILVRQVPFPGCVIAVSNEYRVERNGRMVSGDDAVFAGAQMVSMNLLMYRDDDEDPIATSFARFIRSAAWRYEPTPIARMDVGLTYHEADGGAGAQILELLRAKGLRCCARRVTMGKSGETNAIDSPAKDARALVVMISHQTRTDPWIAYDVGVAWAAGMPVVPVLIGEWKGHLPSILAPYQALSWDKQQQRVVDELVDLLDLTPWSIPALADDRETAPQPAVRSTEPRARKSVAERKIRPAKSARTKRSRRK